MAKFPESAHRVAALMKEHGLHKTDLSDDVADRIGSLAQIEQYERVDPMSLIATLPAYLAFTLRTMMIATSTRNPVTTKS